MDFEKGNCLVRFKAGKLEFNNKTLIPKLEKGIISVFVSLEGMITFQWKKKETPIIDTEMIVFPGDAIAQPIPQKNSGYVQIKETKRSFFFWNQENDINSFYKGIELMQAVFNGEQIQAFDTTIPAQVQPIYTIKNGKIVIADVSLNKVLNCKTIEETLKEHPEDVRELALLCPPEEIEGKTNEELIPVIIDNIRSNQFQETLRLIENAIHAGEGDVICQQTGAELHHQGIGGMRVVLLDIVNRYKL
ncbi:hypothetical protein CL6EHI_095030 [Entamoeba histolytica]|nr:hypothetical protein CL6EHI_095030 [Entamoeba histolytica]